MKLAIARVLIAIAICTPALAQAPESLDLMDRFVRAWNASDPKAISNLFAPDADLIAPDGLSAQGRPAIAAYYAAAFTHGYAGSRAAGQIIRHRPILNDLTLVDSRFSIAGIHNMNGSAKPDEKGAMFVVLRRDKNAWQIIALRERSGGNFIPFPPATR